MGDLIPSPTPPEPAEPPSVVLVNGSAPPPIPAAMPHVNIPDESSNVTISSCPSSPRVEEEQQPSPCEKPCSMEDALRQFLKHESELTVPDYIKRFYQIRLEQEALRTEEEFSCTAACNPCHYARNRYRDILPYDHNRVSLSTSEENPDGYMNASIIQLPGGKTKFIAAQAPLPSTLDEWWQMIDEQRVKLIVMLCRLMEMNRVKCERYWPEKVGEKLIFGEYEVSLEEEQKFDDDEYLLRTLKFEKTGSGEVRTVQQLHYREWPDHGCPSGETQLLNMIDKMAELHDDLNTPVLVHCSAGVGRTGTIISVNHIRELLEADALREVNLYELVMSLRRQRASMVQTQDQYQFVHKCVAHYARRKLGLPEPEPTNIESPRVSPVRPYTAVIGTEIIEDDDQPIDIGTVVPDFPHEPPAPRGPEELGSAAS